MKRRLARMHVAAAPIRAARLASPMASGWLPIGASIAT